MRKFAQRLFILALTVIALVSLTSSLSISTPTVVAGGSDCDTVTKTCRQGNEMMYNLCVAVTGDYANCALQEAQNNIDCITSNGCPYNH